MNSVTAYLGLGSNLGDRLRNLADALELLDRPLEGVSVSRASGIYETEPWGLARQPKFLNCAVEVTTALPPLGLLQKAKEVEAAIGRKPGPRYGPRVADVDILLYGDLTVEEPDLQIPHPRLHLRAFVLVPLAELAPALKHPLLADTVGGLAERTEGKEGVRRLEIPGHTCPEVKRPSD